ncbi:MAG: GNAT family N-acetyltransferase [Muribaculaceae bacterium]|nr:GNAT family N-acetyltransferase [Muribaculaceae bacterium]
MSKKAEILKIWQECFPADGTEWKRMFFDAAYCDDDALTISDPTDNVTVSSLLLLSYAMTFHGQKVGLAYVYGAGTLRKYRARGFMSRLMAMAVSEAAERGDTFVCLIPASDTLRQYYRRFGFATVGYSCPKRYTAAHRFPFSGSYVEANGDLLRLYLDFERLRASRRCAVQQSRTQFLTVMDDARISNSPFAAVAEAESGRVVAMAWGRNEPASDVVRVTELLADSDDAANAVLSVMRKHCPDRPLTLMTHPDDDAEGGNFLPGAMFRVVNAGHALSIIAAAHPSLELTVRVSDPIVADNCGCYRIHSASVEHLSALPVGCVPDLDITPEVLTALMFGSRPIAEVTGLPSIRPRISLMLD